MDGFGHGIVSSRGPVNGFVCGQDGGRGGGGPVVLLLLTHGAERLRHPGKGFEGGASLEGGAAEERPETPVELQTQN